VRNRLEESNAQKDEFLAVMSHELKNPLNVIHMNAQLLMRLPQARNAPVVTKAAQAIASAAASQAQMIDDLLDLSRVNTGKVVLGRVQVVLNEVIERIASAVENDVAAKGLSLHVSLGERLAVSADLVRIEQIVWNLVTNAIKFTPERGSIRISLSRDDTWARLEVSDTGIGLEANHLDQVFEIFRQVDFGTRRKKTGLGIGLAVVKQRVEASHGRRSLGDGARGRSATRAGSRLQCASGEALDAGSFEGRDRSAGADGPLSGGRDCHAVSTSRRRSSC